MAIYRHNHPQSFLVLPNGLIRDERLSLRDLGLLCYMLSLPPDWDFSLHGLMAVLPKDGEHAIRKSLRSLEAAGYLLRRREYREGRIYGCSWKLSDIPGAFTTDDLRGEFLHEEKLHGEIQTQTKNILNKEQKKQRTESTLPSFSIPKEEEVRAYITEQGLQLDASRFVDYYSSVGWMVGNAPMRDWKAAARNWSRKEKPSGEADLPFLWKNDFEM